MRLSSVVHIFFVFY